MGRKILIAVDGSDNSQRAFEMYIEHFHKPNDLVILAHVVIGPHLQAFNWQNPLHMPVEEWQHKIQEHATEVEKMMERYEILCEEHQLQKKPIVEHGSPGEKLCELAEQEKADFIIIGSRGQNSLRRTFTGSVSDYVVHHVHIPVTVVPPPPTDHKH